MSEKSDLTTQLQKEIKQEINDESKVIEDFEKKNYIPSEIERKRVVVYYLLVGIFFALSKSKISKYEYFHLKQAIGWWIVFFLVFVLEMLVFWLPIINLIPGLIEFVLLIIWIIFVRNAWKGEYVVEINGNKKVLLPLFAGIGAWLLNLFEKKFEVI
jgi:uncharacterized membrane protein